MDDAKLGNFHKPNVGLFSFHSEYEEIQLKKILHNEGKTTVTVSNLQLGTKYPVSIINNLGEDVEIELSSSKECIRIIR